MARPPFELNGESVPAGRRRVIDLPVGRVPAGPQMALTLAVAHGKQDGPTIWLSGAIHGDELNGVEAVRRVLDHVAPRELSGTVIAVPAVNVFGLMLGSRYLPDRRDLNRSFPGSRRGSTAARLANIFMTSVVDRSDVGIDFHTAAEGRTNLPQIRADLDDEATARYAAVFAAPAVIHARLRDGSLRQAAGDRGKRVLLFEGGQAKRFESEIISVAIDGTLRVLAELGMIREAPKATAKPAEFRKSTWTRARRAGLLRLHSEPGDAVATGDTLAEIGDTFGRPSVLRASRDGLVIGATLDPVVHRGDAIVHVAYS